MQSILSICREVYNSLVNSRSAAWETEKKSLSFHDQATAIAQYKKCHPELKGPHSQVLQNVAVRVDLAFKAFFRRCKLGETPGYPRLKGHGTYDSFTHPQWGNGVKLVGECLHLSKIGQVRVILHRPLLGTPRTCTIRRQAGKWFACVAVEVGEEDLPTSEEAVGIDVGLTHFAALSDGSFVENPRFFRRDEKALAKAQRKLAKQKRGTAERAKARKVVSRIYERIRNRRHDLVHQLARRLVNRYGIIAVEDLNVKGMVQNHCLAKSIADASWSMFRAVLAGKAESAARRLVAVEPSYTSQDCSVCGFRVRKKLSERVHSCPSCGLVLDRDHNAALNILQNAQTALGLQSVG